MKSARGLAKLIREACAAKAPCSLTIPDQSVFLAGSFVGTVGDGVIFDVRGLPRAPILGAPSIVAVTFNHHEGTTAFVTRILSFTQAPGHAEKARERSNGVAAIVVDGGRMRVAWPTSASHYESRMTFRVPVRDAKLHAEIVGADGIATPTKVIDVSASGAKLALRRSGPPHAPGTELTVRLRLGDTEVTLAAEVRRHDEYGYGVFFPTVLKDGHVCPERALEHIVRELERAWLRRRATV